MAISIEDKVLTNMSQKKINQIINVAAEEIAKYVDVCNEGGQLVMKVKDGVKLKKVDIFLGNNYYISSDKEFCNPVGISEKKAFIDIDQESKVVTRCTIPTSVKFSNKNKYLCAFGVQLGQPHSAIICWNNGGNLLGISYQDFCNVVREKINNMQASSNCNQKDTSKMGIEDLMNYIYEDQPTKKRHKKKTNKHKDPKLEDKKEDKKEEPKVVEKREDQKEDQKEVPQVEEIQTSSNNTEAQGNLISTAEEQMHQTVVEEPQIKQQINIEPQLNIGGQQNAGTQNGPNYIARPGHNQTRPFYKDGHCLQMAKIYFTNNGQLSPEQINQFAAPNEQTQLDQQNQTRLSLNAKPFRTKWKYGN